MFGALVNKLLLSTMTWKHTSVLLAAAVGLSVLKTYIGGATNPHDAVSMLGKTCIVTGANTGIGFETAKQLLAQNATVVMACRSRKRCDSAMNTIKAQVDETLGSIETALVSSCPQATISRHTTEIFPQLDLADFDSVRAFGKAWGKRPLHVLINNAGIMALPEHTIESSGEERQMQVNHHGHFLLTGLLLPALQASAPSRVVAVSSKASEREKGALVFEDMAWQQREYSMLGSYCASKLANVLHARELSRRMAAAGHAVTAVSLHPGVIATELARNMLDAHWMLKAAEPFLKPVVSFFLRTPFQGAQTTLFAATAPVQPWGTQPSEAGAADVVAGQYYADCALKVNPHSQAYSDEVAAQLWEYSEKVTGWSATAA